MFPDEPKIRQAKLLVSPRFRFLGGASSLKDLEETLPTLIMTGLAQNNHIVVVARPDAGEIVTQTVNRISGQDFIEAHDGGTIHITQQVQLSSADLSELSSLLKDDVSTRLQALGVELLVYGKFFEVKQDEIRVDIYLLDVAASALNQAKKLETRRDMLDTDIKDIIDNLAAGIKTYLERLQGQSRRKLFAVLPFKNISRDQSLDNWREGLTEELITVLKNAKALHLVERSATARYKDREDLDLAAVGRELGVDVLLVGSYDVYENEAGNRVMMVRARLVETETGNFIETFREEGKIGYTVQANLAQRIMQALDVQPTSMQEVQQPPTENIDALDYVRIGIHYFDQQDYPKAIASIREAIKLDPNYSDAHFRLGLVYKAIGSLSEALEEFKASLGNAYDRAFGNLVWSIELGNKIHATPVIDEAAVYIGSEDQFFYAIHRSDGSLKWARELDDSVLLAAHLHNGRVFTATSNQVYALDKESGEIIWQAGVEGEVDRNLCGSANTLFVPVNEEVDSEKSLGRLYAFDLETGALLWRYDLPDKIGEVLPLESSLVFGCHDSNLYHLRAADGTPIWKTPHNFQLSYSPVRVDDILYTVSDSIAAISMVTGDILWSLASDVTASCPPVISGDRLYAGFENKLYAINRQTGLIQWVYPNNHWIGSVNAAEGLVYITSQVFVGMIGEHTLLAIDAETAQPYWKHTFSDTIYGRTTIANGSLFISNRNHFVYAFNISRDQVGRVRMAEIWYEIGQVHLQRNNPDQALDAFMRCIETDPTYREAYRSLVSIYQGQKRLAKAVEVQQDYIELLPQEARPAEEAELRRISGLMWARETASLYSMSLVPLKNPAGGDTEGFSPIVPGPAVAGGQVFTSSPDGVLLALDALTGENRWKFELPGEKKTLRSTPVVKDGRVFLGAGDGKLYALSVQDGSILWAYDTGAAIDSTPAYGSELVFFGANDGVHALRPETGELAWHYALPTQVKSSPQVAGGLVYAGAFDGKLYALSEQDGTLQWTYETDDIIVASPVIADGSLYLGPDDNHVYCLDAASGSLRWKYRVEEGSRSILHHGLVDSTGISTFGFLPSTPAVHKGVVYVGSNGESTCHLYALDAASGKLKWRFKVENGEVGSPVIYKDLVFFGAGGVLFHDQHLYGLRADDGSLQWRYKMNGDMLSRAVIDADRLYCWSLGGMLYAFDLHGITSFTPERDAVFYNTAGGVALINNQARLALVAFEKARVLDPKNVDAYAGLADCYEKLGMIQQQRVTLEKFQELSPLSTHSYWRLSSAYSNLGLHEKAIEQAIRYIQVAGTKARGFGQYLLAQAQLTAGMNEQALASYDEAVAVAGKYLGPNYGSSREFAGKVVFLATEARMSLLMQMGMDPRTNVDPDLLGKAAEASGELPPEGYTILGVLHIFLDEYEKAEEFFQNAMDKGAVSAEVMKRMGETYNYKGDYDRAVSAFEKALTFSAGDIRSLTLLGVIAHEHLFDYPKAYEYFGQVHRLIPNDASAIANLLEASITSQHYEEALHLASEIHSMETDPSYLLTARYYHVLAALLKGDETLAAQAAREFIETYKTLPDDFANTWAYDGMNRFLQARTELEPEIQEFLLAMPDLLKTKTDPAILMAVIPPRLLKV